MSKNLVVVLGATGTQGGSVVNALLKHGGYAIRGVTRNPDALAAISLAEKGVDVVSGDLADKDSLIKVFDGAYAVFGVTVAYTPISEELQGQNIVDAAKAASVPLLVWSSLPSATDTSNGKYTTIYHFDQKNAVDKYIATAGQPTVILHTGGFAENLLNFHMLQPDSTDPSKWNAFYPISRSETKMAGVWIDGDLGNIVVAVIDHWKNESWRGKLTAEPIAAAPYELSVEEIVAILTKVTGKTITYVHLKDIPELQKAMFDFTADGFYRFPGQSNILEQLGVKTHSFEDYARDVVLPYFQSQG